MWKGTVKVKSTIRNKHEIVYMVKISWCSRLAPHQKDNLTGSVLPFLVNAYVFTWRRYIRGNETENGGSWWKCSDPRSTFHLPLHVCQLAQTSLWLWISGGWCLKYGAGFGFSSLSASILTSCMSEEKQKNSVRENSCSWCNRLCHVRLVPKAMRISIRYPIYTCFQHSQVRQIVYAD